VVFSKHTLPQVAHAFPSLLKNGQSPGKKMESIKTVRTIPFWNAANSPETVGRKIIEDLLTRSEFMMYVSDHCTAVHYAEACAAFGAARLAGLLKDTATLVRLVERYLKVIEDQIVNTANHVDANVYGILPLELYLQTQNSIFFKQGIELADLQWAHPLPNGLTNQARFWVDDVWMIGSLQIQAYRATGNREYLERAALTVAAYLQKLQQPNGLFFHGECAPMYWGRSNGWVAAGLAEVLSELQEDNVHYASIKHGYQKMMAALLRYQSEDGMWRQLIDHEAAWKETSSTGMFGYALAVGVREGLLPEEQYAAAYQKAWLSLVEYVDAAGQISDVCVGTGQSTDVEFYLNRLRVTGDFHGQAPMLWFAYCLLTMQE
jgi:unsaturated rhamnogalacturonyl hydrolase